jgi:DNA-directed RNA polymerase specialized sigma subunit
MANASDISGKSAKHLALTLILEQCQHGDYQGDNQLVREFEGLIRNLAERRAHGRPSEMSRLTELGREGLKKAARKFRLSAGAAQFQVFAVDYIQRAMDGKNKGFFARLFGR